ncbi:MAG: hypothetical protein JNJ54_33890 [Myxococcaceae bacterium]|nr:hypothetical protein [Myxococcaceae bacterium]
MRRAVFQVLMAVLAGEALADPPAKKVDAAMTRRGSPIAQPLVHPDAWETDLQACALEFKARPRCLTELLLRVPPRQLPLFESEAEKLTAELTRWIGKDDLATVYRVKQLTLGEWMIVRHYVLEDSQGNVKVVKVSFRRVLGEWWLHAFKLIDRDDVEKELGID